MAAQPFWLLAAPLPIPIPGLRAAIPVPLSRALHRIDSVEAINILTYGSTEMTMYPMTVYPDWLRNIFTFLVPTIFMNYFPALYFLGKPDPLGFPTFAPFIAPFVGAAMLIVSIGVFRIGLRHYQGTGT